MKTAHDRGANRRTGPAADFESRTATTAGPRATSTQAPLFMLRLDFVNVKPSPPSGTALLLVTVAPTNQRSDGHVVSPGWMTIRYGSQPKISTKIVATSG